MPALAGRKILAANELHGMKFEASKRLLPYLGVLQCAPQLLGSLVAK